MIVVTPPRGPFSATVAVPGDKSLSHRALFFAAIAPGESVVADRNPGADVAATEGALRALGVVVEGDRVGSPGRSRWHNPGGVVDAVNSGTTMRLLMGAVAPTPLTVVIDGDQSLRRRPMERVAAPLRAMGATVATQDGHAPVTVSGAPLRGTHITLDLPSAQVRSAVALAALAARDETVIEGPGGFRTHTEQWLQALGRGRWRDRTGYLVTPGEIPPMAVSIPGDASAAAFLWAAAALVPGATIVTPGVTLNPARLRFAHLLAEMGAEVAVEATSDALGDPVGVVTVTGRTLAGIEVGGVAAAEASDELPLLALVAAAASGPSVIADAVELRVKESDRIATTATALRGLGAVVTTTGDGLHIAGDTRWHGGVVDAGGDHRIAMMGAVAAAACGAEVAIAGGEAASISWPGFYATLEQAWSSP